MYYTREALIPAVMSRPKARTISLARISMGHHYRSNNCKVIHHIHTTRINVSYYIGSSITTEFIRVKCSSFGNTAEAIHKLTWRIQGLTSSPKMRSPTTSLQSFGSQLTSHPSSGSSLGYTNFLQQPQYSGISAHNNFISKDWATKAQQYLPVNVVINSRLLACKSIGE
jgi:hypothetical protein